MGGADGVGLSRARAGFFAALRSAQNDKVIFILRRILSPVILRSAATKDLARARSPDGANMQGWRVEVAEPKETARRVVAQASFSWTCGPIHLLAPYGAVSDPRGGQLT